MKRINVQSILAQIKKRGDPQRAESLQRFFKTGSGEYGEGDIFAGLQVPDIRKLAKEYQSLPLSITLKLLQSSLHEARLMALLIMVKAYQKGDALIREKIFQSYLTHTRFINNWDLVDLSAEHIVGDHLWSRERDLLLKLVNSKLIWERRIAIMSTFHYIKKREFLETLKIAELLLHDPEDLIHKAAGWMLREIGKRDKKAEERFLKIHYPAMPRTMLRYAIEKFPEDLRQKYLKGKI